VVLIVPSGFMANEPPLAVFACPVSVEAETAPSTIAVVAGDPADEPEAPASAVVDVWTPLAQPPPPLTWMRSFQFACAGSQTSMPMPADVDGASAGPPMARRPMREGRCSRQHLF